MNNREIKFKAWNGSQMSSNVITIQELANKDFAWDANKLVWLEYTGLKDKNGIEIYDGDVLDSGGKYGYIGELVFVTWNQDELQWVVSTKDNDFRDCLRSCFSDKSIVWEVIGNVYQNPNLVTKK